MEKRDGRVGKGKDIRVWEHEFLTRLGNLVAAEAGEVLLVDGRAGRATGVTTGGSTATGRAVTAGGHGRSPRGARSPRPRGAGPLRGGLDVAEVNVKEVLLLALLLALGLLVGRLDVGGFVLLGELLGGSPLLVELAALVGSALGLGGEGLALGLLGKVVGEGLGVVGLLLLLGLGGGLGLALLLLGKLLALALVIQGLLAALGTPALLDLLAGVAPELSANNRFISPHTGLVATSHTATTASVGLGVTSRLLLGGITLSGAVNGAVDSLGGGEERVCWGRALGRYLMIGNVSDQWTEERMRIELDSYE
ncbi:hypothetical protein N7505_010728 [Penicillium chrysogenum]|uniref:Uncharacterized protein n=1 Tax=Penicillium chrysogenum TaxID=5076 RepID=A0ABQ8W4H8_PENCH|nr:hypothetical protein N7505_010728 [Penicillium chrysogenum]